MTEIVRAGQLSISLVQAAGDGSFGTAAAVDIPTANSMLLVELPADGNQGIKLPTGNVGDRADIFTISRVSSGTDAKLRIFDADGNVIGGVSGLLPVGLRLLATKILPVAYSSSGMVSAPVGTWIGDVSAIPANTPST